MPYRLKGILKSPNGQPLTGVDLQFIAQQTLSPVLQQTDHNIRLGLDGSYDVSLEFNTYAVKAQIGGIGAQHMGYIEVNADTTAGLDLPQLLRLQSQAPTAPDYVKMIEEWLNEAKAAADKATTEAALAKTQADRAKSEADRASEISGLETVAEAVGLAAVPFPDVWIPFNDSLRMIAGFGRDVKVGSDTVATLVNYERATTATMTNKSNLLQSVAINEPRFEKQGLLREAQGTNLIPYSEDFTKWAIYKEPIIEKSSGIYTKITPTGAPSGVIARGYTTLTIGKKYAISFWAYADTPAGVIIGLESEPQLSGVVLNVTTAPTRYTKIVTATQTVATMVVYGNDLKKTPFYIGGIQVEEAPAVSSYIRTTGSAVTRAADNVTIPRLNNDCAEWYSGADKITPTITDDKIEFMPPAGKRHIRNLKGFFTPLTDAQKKGLK